MERLLPLLSAFSIYLYWRFSLPYMRRPILNSPNFYIRHSPFFVIMLGGGIINSISFIEYREFFNFVFFLGCGIMLSAIALPYFFTPRDKTGQQ